MEKAHTVFPTTSDHNSLINLFQDIEYGMVEDGTAIGDGLGNSINRLIDSETKSKIIFYLLMEKILKERYLHLPLQKLHQIL